ncbi:FtsX-like permease family protein [Anaerocolumna sedimenticola]|uniref:FtsX-like permease family protein n=1 Tax=Anaerocolumna sedimenticola TaxID=2696063 RepID=A0A6P1TQE1_9FIRM|nr:ABC transporter permease [Anaerocolumna sedimenticola]QHQ62412.1 FtsX-like permease family protein [Anaerocolumna sedimenticola]
MGKSFFLRLALTNIQRDKKMYLPFVIASTAFVSIYFMVVTIMYSKGIADVPAGKNLQDMFSIGMVIMNVITVIFMFYINSFLIKRRKKEFGLYGILGLEKRHVGRIIIWENFIISGASIFMGILFGCIFSKLIFMIIFYTLRVSPNSRFQLPAEAFELTIILFLGIFLFTSLFNLLQIRMANPIDLIKGDRMGEKKVHFIFLKTLSGAVLLGWAYYSALTVNNAFTALTQFLLAVLAVIAASFLLFEAGSLFFLNILKGKKKVYYKSNNFIAIAGLFHRMKQNAAGLASICILSTMVLVTVSTCTALFLGQEDMLTRLNPNDMQIEMSEAVSEGQIKQLDTLISSLVNKHDITITDQFGYNFYRDDLLLKDGALKVPGPEAYESGASMAEITLYLREVDYITLEDYNKICSTKETLSPNEILLLTNHADNNMASEITSLSGDFKIKSIILDSKFIQGKNSEEDSKLFIVAADKKEGLNLMQLLNPNLREIYLNRIHIINITGKNNNLNLFSKEVQDKSLKIENVAHFKSIFTDREEGYGLYGGLLFLGIFFTILFLVATVLIIYFKQISEGYEDKERFIILQKVGMDDFEVKRTINKQILIVFFLPLLGALLHVSMAEHMITKLLEAFHLFNNTLTAWCIFITCIVFMAAYILVYRLTAKTYYKIVKWN